MSNFLTFKPEKTLGKYQHEVLQDLLNKIFPVGAIYFSIHGENPNETIGGHWELIEGLCYIRRR